MLKVTKELDGNVRIVQGRMELRIKKDERDNNDIHRTQK